MTKMQKIRLLVFCSRKPYITLFINSYELWVGRTVNVSVKTSRKISFMRWQCSSMPRQYNGQFSDFIVMISQLWWRQYEYFIWIWNWEWSYAWGLIELENLLLFTANSISINSAIRKRTRDVHIYEHESGEKPDYFVTFWCEEESEGVLPLVRQTPSHWAVIKCSHESMYFMQGIRAPV